MRLAPRLEAPFVLLLGSGAGTAQQLWGCSGTPRAAAESQSLDWKWNKDHIPLAKSTALGENSARRKGAHRGGDSEVRMRRPPGHLPEAASSGPLERAVPFSSCCLTSVQLVTGRLLPAPALALPWPVSGLPAIHFDPAPHRPSKTHGRQTRGPLSSQPFRVKSRLLRLELTAALTLTSLAPAHWPLLARHLGYSQPRAAVLPRCPQRGSRAAHTAPWSGTCPPPILHLSKLLLILRDSGRLLCPSPFGSFEMTFR